MHIGDFSGLVVERPGIREVLPGAQRVPGHSMDGVLRNRAGNAWSSVRVPDESGLSILAEYRGLTALAGALGRCLVCRRLRGFRDEFADWVFCGASGDREGWIPGARRAH